MLRVRHREIWLSSWAALLKGIETMPESAAIDSKDSPVITSAEPQLFVSDLDIACRFYVRQLGFQIAFSYGGRLNLRKVGIPLFDAGFRASEVDALSATLTLDDPKPLFLEYQAAGVSFHQSLRTEPWGARTFIVQDPDGNLIAFSGSGISVLTVGKRLPVTGEALVFVSKFHRCPANGRPKLNPVEGGK
jgi:catechol 2,3-dioxygenase-like lactoylglutathione lyase family enzyme